MDTVNSEIIAKINYIPKTLEFTFDEFVEVKNANKEVFISPALVYRPKIISRGKKIQVVFDKREVLKPNTTYNINFGNAIVDFHEGNVLKNFGYYFATGDKIDSLQVGGQVFNALTNEPETELLVGLFSNENDSIVFNERPIYVTRLEDDGKFQFKYISSGSFIIAAIDDKNSNFKYDPVNEKIGFVTDAITLTDSMQSYTFYSSISKSAPIIIGKQINSYGQAYFKYTNLPDSLSIVSNPEVPLQYDTNLDTLFVMYQTDLDSFQLMVNSDTFQIKVRNREKWAEKYSFINYKIKESTLLVSDTLHLKMNTPFNIIDTSKIVIFDSTRYLKKLNIIHSGRKLSVVYPWTAGKKYTFVIDSAALSDIYGKVNDSIKHEFLTLTTKELCNYTVTIKGLSQDTNYVINILRRDKSILASKNISNDTIARFELKQIRPEGYDIEIFEDINKNNRWDPGDYLLKRQPEKYKLFKGEQLKPDRDFDKDISWLSSPIESEEKALTPKGK
ncbi:MAG: Ig-like domain-containing protein [Saprospiraceae bacterium]